MNPFLANFFKLLPLLPTIIQGAEMIYTGAKRGAEKKELALASLGLSTAVAGVVAPQHKEAIDAASKTASALIDGIVATINATKAPASAAVAGTGH